MARVLKCCRSTIFRELKRNHFSDDCIPKCYGYYGAAAQLMAADRCALQRKLIKYPELFKRVLAENEITRGLPGKYVDSYEYPERRLEFRWKGVSLPYSVFDKDQRVTHAAITENKRLGAVLQFIKEEQDKAPPKKPRAGKQRSHYKPNGRRNDGWNSLAARRAEEDREANRGCDI